MVRLGQHYLVDKRVIKRLVEYVMKYNPRVCLEVGVGKAALTKYFINTHTYVVGVEIDSKHIKYMQDVQESAINIDLVLADALHPPAIIERIDVVYGSIPYEITSPLLRIIVLEPPKRAAVLLLQREVANRLQAKAGEKRYGRLTILVQYRYKIYAKDVVKPTSFNPKPKVYSRIVVMERKSTCESEDLIPKIEHVTRCLFSFKNKVLRRALTECFPKCKVVLESMDTRRVRDLTLDEIVLIARKCINGE